MDIRFISTNCNLLTFSSPLENAVGRWKKLDVLSVVSRLVEEIIFRQPVLGRRQILVDQILAFGSNTFVVVFV